MSDDSARYLTPAGLSPGDIAARRYRSRAIGKTAGHDARYSLDAFVASGDKTSGDIHLATNDATESDDPSASRASEANQLCLTDDWPEGIGEARS